MRTPTVDKHWLSMHQCIDEKCPVHAGFTSVQKSPGYLAGEGMPQLPFRNTLHQSIVESTDIDKCMVNLSTRDDIKPDHMADSIRTVHGNVKTEPRFLCTWLNENSDINNFPFYKKAISSIGQPLFAGFSGVYSRSVTDEIWESHKYAGTDQSTHTTEDALYQPAISKSSSHEKCTSDMISYLLKDIATVDISDLKVKYAFLFDPQYIFRPRYDELSQKLYRASDQVSNEKRYSDASPGHFKSFHNTCRPTYQSTYFNTSSPLNVTGYTATSPQTPYTPSAFAGKYVYSEVTPDLCNGNPNDPSAVSIGTPGDVGTPRHEGTPRNTEPSWYDCSPIVHQQHNLLPCQSGYNYQTAYCVLNKSRDPRLKTSKSENSPYYQTVHVSTPSQQMCYSPAKREMMRSGVLPGPRSDDYHQQCNRRIYATDHDEEDPFGTIARSDSTVSPYSFRSERWYSDSPSSDIFYRSDNDTVGKPDNTDTIMDMLYGDKDDKTRERTPSVDRKQTSASRHHRIRRTPPHRRGDGTSRRRRGYRLSPESGIRFNSPRDRSADRNLQIRTGTTKMCPDRDKYSSDRRKRFRAHTSLQSKSESALSRSINKFGSSRNITESKRSRSRESMHIRRRSNKSKERQGSEEERQERDKERQERDKEWQERDKEWQERDKERQERDKERQGRDKERQVRDKDKCIKRSNSGEMWRQRKRIPTLRDEDLFSPRQTYQHFVYSPNRNNNHSSYRSKHKLESQSRRR